NAIYFKAHWAVPFDKDLTREKPFYLAGGGEVSVNTMHRTGEFLYRKSEDFEMVGLPYKGGMVTFAIFLPTPGLTFDDMRPRFKAEYMDNAIAQASMSLISLALPRLSLRWGEELREPLIAMGLGVLFGKDANLKGITAESGVSIGEIIHKAAMDLDEEGTEAAATIANMLGGSAMDIPPPIIVQVDRPFLFAIRDNTSGVNLFLGQVHNPTTD
ncbi:serpin family protein, partial [Thermodesulfobacteriota bacterium]